MTGWWKQCAVAAIVLPSSRRAATPLAWPGLALSYNTCKQRIFLPLLIAE